MSPILKQIYQIAKDDPLLQEDDVAMLIRACAHFSDSALLFMKASARRDPTHLRSFIDSVYDKKTAMDNDDTAQLSEIAKREKHSCAQEMAAGGV